MRCVERQRRLGRRTTIQWAGAQTPSGCRIGKPLYCRVFDRAGQSKPIRKGRERRSCCSASPRRPCAVLLMSLMAVVVSAATTRAIHGTGAHSAQTAAQCSGTVLSVGAASAATLSLPESLHPMVPLLRGLRRSYKKHLRLMQKKGAAWWLRPCVSPAGESSPAYALLTSPRTAAGYRQPCHRR